MRLQFQMIMEENKHAQYRDANTGRQTSNFFFWASSPSLKKDFFSLLRKVVCLPRIYCSRPQETSFCWVGAWYAAFRSRVIGWQWLEEFWDGPAMIWRSGNDMEVKWHWSLPKRITALNQIKTRQGGNTSQPKVIELARHGQGWNAWQWTTGDRFTRALG